MEQTRQASGLKSPPIRRLVRIIFFFSSLLTSHFVLPILSTTIFTWAMVVPWDLVATAIAFAIAVILTSTSAWRTIRQARSDIAEDTATPRLYEDKDGVATEKSQAAYSVKIQNALATLFAVAGFGISLAVAVRGTLAGTNVITWWLHFGVWVSWECTRSHETEH